MWGRKEEAKKKRERKVNDDAVEVFLPDLIIRTFEDPAAVQDCNIYQPMCNGEEIKFRARHQRNRAYHRAPPADCSFLSFPSRFPRYVQLNLALISLLIVGR